MIRNLLKFTLPFILGALITAIIIVAFPQKIKVVEKPAVNNLMTDDSNATVNPVQWQNDEISNSRENAITRAVRNVSPAVVGINVTQVKRYYAYSRNPWYDWFFDTPYSSRRNAIPVEKKIQSLGSGFIFTEDGYILTNHHVVANAAEIIVTLPGGEQYDAQVIGEDFESDVAVVKIDGKNLPTIEFGDSEDVIIGEWIIALGNPFGLFDITTKPTVTVGVVSAKDQDFGVQEDGHVFDDMIQTDAAINGGNSGGPLVNSDGKVIGINTWIISGSETRSASIGLGFATPINHIKEILDDLMEHGGVQNEDDWTTGIHYEAVSPLIAISLGMRQARGVIITDIDRGSPAQKAGLKLYDVILTINNNNIIQKEDVSKVIDKLNAKVGDVLNLKIYRDGKVYDAKIELAANR